MEHLQIDTALLARLSRWATRLDVPLSRLVTHLLVVGVERLEQGAENVSVLYTAEVHSTEKTAEEGASDGS